MKIVKDEIGNMQLWRPGQVIIMREVWRNSVYSIVPVCVVQDTLSWSVLYLSRHTPYLIPHTLEGIMIRIPTDTWVLQNVPYECGGSIVHLDGNWEKWKPDPVGRVPLGLPDGWDRV